MATAKTPAGGGNEETPAPTRRGNPFEQAQAEQAQLDELEALRARQRELEAELGVTSVGHARGAGIRGEIQALLRERVGYVRRSANPDEKDRMEGRVAQVDEQLNLRGYRVGKDLEKDTQEAIAAAGPGVLVEDAMAAREARQTTR